MKRLLIVANLPSDNARALAEQVLAGASDPACDGVRATLVEALEACADDVLACDAIILGTTENFGSLSGRLKDFLERVYHPCLERSEGKPWALWVRAGNDGTGAVQATGRIVTGLRWREVQPALVLAGPWQDTFGERARELGLSMGAALSIGAI